MNSNHLLGKFKCETYINTNIWTRKTSRLSCSSVWSMIYFSVFLFHLFRYNFKNYQFVLALLFAIEEINRNLSLLPNISLGFHFHNVPQGEKNILAQVLIWLTGQSIPPLNYNCVKEIKSAAALTGPSWATSAHIGTVLHLYKFPQVRNHIWFIARYSCSQFRVMLR